MNDVSPRITVAAPPAARRRDWVFSLAVIGLTAGLSGCANRSGPQPPPLVAAREAAHRCVDLDFPIYFERGADVLSSAAQRVLADAVVGAKGCQVVGTVVTGLTPPDATPAELALSKARAIKVAEALTHAGLPEPAPEKVDTRTARSRVRLARQTAHVMIRLTP